MLELKNLCKKYEKNAILDDVSLSLPKGGIAILLGHSGVGKSTLLRAINNLEKADSGQFFLNGELLDLKNIHKSNKVGMVFQDYNLLKHLTVKQNIILPLTICLNKNKTESNLIADKLLEQYNLTEKANVFPAKLSGGQKQRLAIARAVAMGSPVLCMDEPTSALDPLATNQVALHIKQLADQGYMILIATHDTALIDKFDCDIHLMEKGKIVESAESHQFLANRKNYPHIREYILGKR